ncbi:MAG: GTP 3',8-cyclase MoaA [Methanobrevibacter sp.]|uniref:GTP 3',8-cyclase MoaA n=1 Tax=Methanobrevibacter TaxID=2172 RepID=UPI00257EB48D|nr:GTP 3',8-cyclase MoaA [Methanobrevibacter sp.]MBR2665080.1 GTP 3',8-cyclase MoaA [Methanobrevibacter sp.]MBR3198227.1 GTP 3',8-cyclase MoaA [Methanobrevibacter sp.]MBR7050279.1 GTP 3',8-cyclase MoaA [Methanobrevibacter sp.]
MLDGVVLDKYERPILSLRITLTNRCNVNCLYCHHDGMVKSKDEMTADELYTICKIAKKIGVRKIRLSGGEPLLKNDIVEIVERIASLDFKDISMTTNGILLEKYAQKLKDAGLDRVNVSLDTLNRETFEFITKKDYLEDAKRGILKAVEVGLYPVKINMVIMKDINQDEIDDMFEFCKENNIVLQLIELIESENCDDDKFSVDYHYKLDDIEKELADIADDVREREFMQGRKKYYINGGEIEVVKPVDNAKFCANCSRLRITPDGKIKPCLLRNDNLVELISHVRNGESEEKLEEIFIKGINKREPFNS